MNILVSADSFSSFTSGFPVRGMMLELIKMRTNDIFHLYYSRRETPKMLSSFYEEINHLPNVQIHFYPYSAKGVEIRRLLCINTVKESDKYDLFINPGRVEHLPGFKGPEICSVADLSVIKGISTGKNNLFWRRYNKILYPYVFKRLSKIVCISNFTKTDILGFWPQFRKKITIVYNGIDDYWFDDEFEEYDKGFKGDYFIWWGLISRRKNIDNLISAYNIVKDSNPNLPKLLLVGKIQEHMKSIKGRFNDSIINIPFQEKYKLKYLVRNSRGLLFPSLYEGFGLPVIEAFSQGVGVACSNVTSITEIAGSNAILFNPNSIDEIAHAIIKLYNSQSDKDKLMSYASRFTYVQAATQYSNIIDNLV